MDKKGVDSRGNVYGSAKEFWDIVAKQKQTVSKATSESKSDAQLGQWYNAAVKYWDEQEASNNGVLGGFGQVNPADIQDSRSFLLKSYLPQLKEAQANERVTRAADCGAGIGRVAGSLLMHYFQEVDLVEPSEHLLKAAQKNLVDVKPASIPKDHIAVRFIQCGLEAFEPEAGRYDIIWVQWALMYLTDDDAVKFLQRCASSLRTGGRIFIKENVCDSGFIVDADDCSITRSHAYNIELFTKLAGLKIANTSLQRNFPKQLFKVRMYALKFD